MPTFFDTSFMPIAERSVFQPFILGDEQPAPIINDSIPLPPEPFEDTGLPITSDYNFDMIQAMVQDPFHIFVYWRFAKNPFDHLDKIFPSNERNGFYTALRLTDVTNGVSVFFDAGYTQRYWISVYPNRKYRIEIGLRSSRYGFVRLLSSKTVATARGGPSETVDNEKAFRISHHEFLRALREGHMIPNKRDYKLLLSELKMDEIPDELREFIASIQNLPNDPTGEIGYMMLLRFLPELVRRARLIQTLKHMEETGGTILQSTPDAIFYNDRATSTTVTNNTNLETS